MKPSERYKNQVEQLRNMMFGRFSRRNVRGQNRNGGWLRVPTVERVKADGRRAIAELSEKYAKA